MLIAETKRDQAGPAGGTAGASSSDPVGDGPATAAEEGGGEAMMPPQLAGRYPTGKQWAFAAAVMLGGRRPRERRGAWRMLPASQAGRRVFLSRAYQAHMWIRRRAK